MNQTKLIHLFYHFSGCHSVRAFAQMLDINVSRMHRIFHGAELTAKEFFKMQSVFPFVEFQLAVGTSLIQNNIKKYMYKEFAHGQG